LEPVGNTKFPVEYIPVIHSFSHSTAIPGIE